MGGRSSLTEQHETNTDEKVLGNSDMGGETITIYDCEWVSGDGRLELRANKFDVRERKGWGGIQVLATMDGPYGRGDFGQVSVEIEGRSRRGCNYRSGSSENK